MCRRCQRRESAPWIQRLCAAFRLGFDLVSDASPEQQDSLLKLTERNCVVLQTLGASPAVTTNVLVATP